jgi:KDO2-lipid IV(A) lauroyltransferase
MKGFLRGLFYYGVWTLLKAGQTIVMIFPAAAVSWVATSLADAGFFLVPRVRRTSVANLTIALGDEMEAAVLDRVARQSMRNFFLDMPEIGHALRIDCQRFRAEIPVSGREHLDAALAKGKGMIALGSHLGNFCLVGARLAAEGYPVSVLVKPPRNLRIAGLMDDYRQKLGQKTVRARPRLQATRELIHLLRDNEIAVVIADEFRSNGIPAPFFGHPVAARRGPVTLALRTGAAVVPVYMFRQANGRLALMIEPELNLTWSGRLTEDIRSNTVLVTAWLEQVVRAHPEQWNWMVVRWQEGLRDLPHRSRRRFRKHSSSSRLAGQNQTERN